MSYSYKGEKFVIGLTGPIGAGKDTAGLILSRSFPGVDTYLDSFAFPIKASCHVIFGLSYRQLNTQEGKQEFIEDFGMTSRNIQRFFGNEALKPVFGSDLWVKSLFHRTVSVLQEVIIITDVRFQQEVDFVRQNGILVHVERPNNPLADQMSNHSSDAGVEFNAETDLILVNTARSAADFNNDVAEFAEYALVPEVTRFIKRKNSFWRKLLKRLNIK